MHGFSLAAGALALLLSFSSQALASDHPQHGVTTQGTLRIDQPWSRAVPPVSKNGAVFVSIHNSGETDRLVGAASPVAAQVELHTHIHQEGLMRMVKVEAIEVPGNGGQLELKPGSYHIMLLGLKQPLNEHDHFPLELNFATAGKVALDVEVRSPDAGTGAQMHH